MTTMAELIAFHDITQLKYRYVRAIDTQDYELLRDCYTDDAEVWYGGGARRRQGREAIVSMLRELMADRQASSHIAVHPELKLTSETTATGIWRFQDIVHFLVPCPIFAEGVEALVGAGYYYDKYELHAEGWKIRSTGYERLFETTESGEARRGIHLAADPLHGRPRTAIAEAAATQQDS
jgi:hypothetical protein